MQRCELAHETTPNSSLQMVEIRLSLAELLPCVQKQNRRGYFRSIISAAGKTSIQRRDLRVVSLH